MILNKYFNPRMVLRYMHLELVIGIAIPIIVYLTYATFSIHGIRLPPHIATLVGSALAIFLAFRNNSAYDRWWEARTLWGGVVNSSRVLSRLICTLSPPVAGSDKALQRHLFNELFVKMQIAWVHTLRMHLRQEDLWHQIERLLTPQEFEQLLRAGSKPNCLQLEMGRRLYEAVGLGLLSRFDAFQIEQQLEALNNFQGGCERIKNTPLLRQYHFFTEMFILFFTILLPFCLIGDFEKIGMTWIVVPTSFLISFIFGVMGKVGEMNEDPFENSLTDVPLTSLCNTIELDLLETLGESEPPDKLSPTRGFIM